MNIRRTVAGLGLFAIAAAASAQVPIPAFVGPHNENFDAMAVGSYAGFSGFGGLAGIGRIGTGGALIVNSSTAILPPFSRKNDMFGRGVDVRIRFQSVHKRFGGRFRVPWAGVPVTWMRVFFYKGGLLVGAPVGAPVNNAAWQWRGWDLGPLGGFDEVRIFGNGTLPGYVGMDSLTAG
jgi:hypothetical protein